MRRREVVTGLGVAALCLPIAARAQKTAPVIGFLSGTSPVRYAPFLTAFREALGEAGFIEGQNIAIEYRWAEGAFDRLPAMAEDLVNRKVNVIVTSGGTLAAAAAKKATDTIPTVFIAGDDPVANGLVASLARPGGNRTGISFLVVDLNAKRLELLSELVPQAKTVGLLVNPGNSTIAERIVREVREAAAKRSLQLVVLNAATEREIDAALASFQERGVAALLIGNDAFFNSQRERLIALAARYRLPASYEAGESVKAGGLMSYGANVRALYRQLGVYTGRVLKGAKPADLPVEQPTKFELVVNLRTARTLGLTVPPLLLAQADEAIE